MKCLTAHKDRGRILFVFVSACGWKKPEYPQLELRGWWRHYAERYRSSRISFLYLSMYLYKVLESQKFNSYLEDDQIVFVIYFQVFWIRWKILLK